VLSLEDRETIWCGKKAHLVSWILPFLQVLLIYIGYRCLAHIINLAMQALISTRSKAKYYDPNAEDSHVPNLEADADRNEVGLIRAITVKACSSSQQKELFKSIQVEDHKPPLQLLLDMKVWWGSTHSMLLRAESCKDVSYLVFFCPVFSNIFTASWQFCF